MLKSDRPFSGFDDFFYTGDRHHLLSGEEIRKRIQELDSLYADWTFPFWKFSADPIEQSQLWHYCKDTIDALSESSKCYIMAAFNASIMMSSIAAERLNRCVLLLHRNELKMLFEPVRDSKTKEPTIQPQTTGTQSAE